MSRGGVNFLARLLAERADRPRGLVSASRGNHSQSLAFARRAFGIPETIVVPEGNSPDKDSATEASGAELLIHGDDFQAAREYSVQLGEERGLVPVPPFRPWLVEVVATYAAELHRAGTRAGGAGSRSFGPMMCPGLVGGQEEKAQVVGCETLSPW